LTSALGSEPIKLRFPTILGESPLGDKQSLTLKSPKGGIQCAFLEQQGIVALAANKARYGITVKLPPN
jgi:hypothetical protein